MATQPTSIRVRMYNVGFGDCFLLTFRYPGDVERHLLIDYGTNAAGEKGIKLAALGDRIAADTGGKLAGVVLSHRHRDHIKGFDPDVAGLKIKALAPDVVLRSWTEEPGLEDEVEDDDEGADDDDPGFAIRQVRRDLVRSLSLGEELALGLTESMEGAHHASLRFRLGVFAAEELKNREAVEMLHELSEGGRGRYLSAGEDPQTDDALPGVKITVLGPPTPEVWPAIRRQKADDPQYWFQLRDSLPAALRVEAETVGAEERVGGAPLGPEAWLVEQLRREGVQSAMRVVLALNKALNNTSLILLIEAAGRRLLFPGDAQIENWSYSLFPDSPGFSADVITRLGDLDLYKVGHHGSRNATPKLGLLPLWQVAGAPKVPVAVLSTLEGPYDDNHPVPSEALVTALGTAPLTLIRSDKLAEGETSADIEL